MRDKHYNHIEERIDGLYILCLKELRTSFGTNETALAPNFEEIDNSKLCWEILSMLKEMNIWHSVWANPRDEKETE